MSDKILKKLAELEETIASFVAWKEREAHAPRMAYDKKQAAFLLNVSERWLATLEAEHGLQSFTLGAKKLYSHTELERFVRSKEGRKVEAVNAVLESHGTKEG